MCCAAWSSEFNIIDLGVSHLHHWRYWLLEQGPHSLDKHISDTSRNHLEYFQAIIQRHLYSSFYSFMNCLRRIRLVEISLAKCSGALYFNGRTAYYNTRSVIFWRVNVAEVFFKNCFSLHLNLSSACSLRHQRSVVGSCLEALACIRIPPCWVLVSPSQLPTLNLHLNTNIHQVSPVHPKGKEIFANGSYCGN